MSQIPSWERTWSSAVLLKCLTLSAANSSPTYAVPSLSSVPTGSQGMTSVALKASQLFKCSLIHVDKYPASASYVHKRLEEYKLALTAIPCPQNADCLVAIGRSQEITSHHTFTEGGHFKNCRGAGANAWQGECLPYLQVWEVVEFGHISSSQLIGDIGVLITTVEEEKWKTRQATDLSKPPRWLSDRPQAYRDSWNNEKAGG